MLDVDLDGDLDVAIHMAPSNAPHALLLLLNAGPAGFVAPPALPLSGVLIELVAADLDGDGDLDLVSGEATSLGARALFNLGGGAFSAPLALGAPSTQDLEVVDIDLDGDLDLVVAGAVSRLFLNDGSGAFTQDVGFPSHNASRTSSWDVDGDGAPEAYLNEFLYRRAPSGTWTLLGGVPTGLPASLGPFDYVTRDFDADGDVDTFVGSGYAHVALAPGVVQTVALPFPRFAETLLSPDLDRDGSFDLLGADATPLVNRTRHLNVDGPFSPGRPTHVRLYGAANGGYLLYGSLPHPFGPLALPPFGTVFLEPPSLLLLSSGALDANGNADAQSVLPASAISLIGLEILLQGVVDTAAGPRLTNARRARFEGY